MAAVLPTFHNSSTSTLRTPGDVAAYLIRFMFSNPGRTSEHYEAKMISFQKLAADYESDRPSLAGAIQSRLQSSMSKYFPGAGISVSVRYEMISDPYYRLVINIVDGNGVPVMSGTQVNVQNGIITLSGVNETRRPTSEYSPGPR